MQIFVVVSYQKLIREMTEEIERENYGQYDILEFLKQELDDHLKRLNIVEIQVLAC